MRGSSETFSQEVRSERAGVLREHIHGERDELVDGGTDAGEWNSLATLEYAC